MTQFKALLVAAWCAIASIAVGDNRDYNADKLSSLLQRASQADSNPVLSRSELEDVLGPHDGVERTRPLFSAEPELYWNLPNGKRVQARVIEDAVPYVGLVYVDSGWKLVWK